MRLTEGEKTGAGCLAALLLTPIQVLFQGWVLKVLWSWFVAPVLGVPTLGILQAYGLMVVIRFAWPTPVPADEKGEHKAWTAEWWGSALARMFAIPAFSLAIGWIVHWLMTR